MLFYNYISSPLGDIELCADNSGLVSVLFVNTDKRELIIQKTARNFVLKETEQQLAAYFKKQLTVFDIPLSIVGTEFQQRVWKELAIISFGTTVNYLQLAKQLGDPKCIRAAATANGKNPISIIIPCHRVIGSNGTLVGYSGNLQRKQWLLKHEGLLTDLFDDRHHLV